jgi:hypothetical protein
MIHIVGSVPLPDAETTFKTLSETLGPYLRSLPDGETGARLDWIRFLEPVFADNPAFEPAGDEFLVHAAASPMRRYRLKRGATGADIEFGNLLYADCAVESWKIFARLVNAGAIPENCRYQVDIAPAHSPCRVFVADGDQAAVEPKFDAGLKREIDRIAAAIPHDRLAIQFDVASAVFFNLERGVPTRYGRTKAEMHAHFAAEMIELGNHVPRDIDLIYHLCYGDNNHKHSIEPTDMSDLVTVANNVAAGISRPIRLFHMPVPRNRSDTAYFAPLQDLKLPPETDISLGLVHFTDGVAGTRKRIATAKKFIPDFLIATECGFGRRDPATLDELLRIHAAVAEEG